jgi:hypothetical protein
MKYINLPYLLLPLREHNIFTHPDYQWDFLNNEARVIHSAMFNWSYLEDGIVDEDDEESENQND